MDIDMDSIRSMRNFDLGLSKRQSVRRLVRTLEELIEALQEISVVKLDFSTLPCRTCTGEFPGGNARAVLSGLAACACFYAGLLPIGDLSGLSVLAPVWAGVVTYIDIKTTSDWCLKSIAAAIIGAVVGIGVGSAVHAFVSV
ncbi:hypothetical protein FOZ63_017796, partial [Perkinsus olseni]